MGIDYIKERNDFNQDGFLKINDLPKDPFLLFKTWMEEAISLKVNEPNAMSIATVDENGCPHSRIVYLRDLGSSGLVFFSNYDSDKGKNISSNPNVAAGFFWPELSKQVRIEGKVRKAEKKISDDYFASRPRLSQLGAWASSQSAELKNRAELEARLSEYDQKFKEMDIPRPDNWGGYEFIPSYFEFWLGQPSRLHDRIVYKKETDNWVKFRLNP